MAKSISGPIGRGGRNFPEKDVLTVQYLLNCVPARNGGPQPELVMDGICGPKTVKAIEGFQMRNLGFADGRVDPAGPTLLALQKYDPAPNQPLGMAGSGKSGHGKGFGKGGGFPGGSKAGGKWPHDPGSKAGWKWPQDPWSKAGGKWPQDPWSKAGGKWPQDPFSKQGPGGKFGQDPWSKAGGKWPQDPWSKTGGKMGPGGKFG